MDLINQVRLLKQQTNSEEVKNLCESFLKGEIQISESQLNEMTSDLQNIGASYNPPKDLREQIRDEEISASKRIAESLMNNWEVGKIKSLNNSGSYLSLEKEIKENESNLVESLSQHISDPSARSFVETQGLNNLGILEGLDTLKGCGINQHPGFKMMAEKYSGLIKYKNIPETRLIHGFIHECSAFKWDSDVEQVVESIQNRAEKYSREIEIIKVLESIQNSANRSFYSELSDSLNEWIVSNDKSSALLAKNIQKWSFNPVVKNLINFLTINESKGTGKLELPIVNQGESRVERIYTAAHISEGVSIFLIGNTLFEMSDNGLTKLGSNGIKGLPNDYVNLISALAKTYVKVNEDGVFVNLGRSTVRLIEEDLEKSVYFNNKKIKFNTLNELGKYLSMEIGSFIGGVNENAVVKDVIEIYKGLENIVELDFAKSIVSNIYEGVSINLLKHNNEIYLNRVNESMRENSLYKVNGTQAVQAVKEFLRYDISEGLTEFLEGDHKVKSIMVNDRTKVLENISKVELEIDKIESLIESSTEYAQSEQIKSAHRLLSNELGILKEKWNQINNELKKLDFGISQSCDLNEDSAFDIGDYIKVKESGETGKIISIDGTSGRYTVLLDNGKTSDFIVNEIVDLDTALSQAADKNSEENPEDYDGEEEVKENTLNKSTLSVEEQVKILKNLASGHGFSKAPGTKKGDIDIKVNDLQGYNLTMNETSKKEASSQDTYAKAPGDSKMGSQKNANPKGNLSSAPVAKGMVNGKTEGKDSFPTNAPETKGKSDFEAGDETGSDYETGYNLREGNIDEDNDLKKN